MQNTTISEWDIQDATLDAYFKDHLLVNNYLNLRKGNPRQVAGNLRLLLEHYLRVKFPSQFEEGEWLGDFIGKIRNADTASPLYFAKEALGELTAINAYSKKYHHATNPGNADKEPIDDTELQGFCKRTLDLIHGKPPTT
jgi:hypothetical protein